MMKRGVSSLILILAVLSVHAQTNFFEGTWKEAFAEAKKQDKYLFIDCYTDWCGWCKMADKKTFPNDKVAEVLNKSFISVKVDVERGLGVELAMKYRVMGFPSYLMFTPDGSFAQKMSGYIENPEEFMAQVKKSKDEKGRPNYPAKLMDDVSFPDFYKKVFTNKDNEEKRTNPEEGEVDAWLASQEDLMSVAAWSVMYRFPMNEKHTEAFLSNLRDYIKIFGKTEVLEAVGQIANQKLGVAIESNDRKELEETLTFVDKYMNDDKENTKASFKLRFFEGTENWYGYAKAAQNIIDMRGLKNHINSVNNYSWTIYENATDEKVLSIAIGWMSGVVILDPQYMYLDTYAALFFKAGKYDEAITWAEKAIEKGKADGENVQETEELRDQIVAAKDRK